LASLYARHSAIQEVIDSLEDYQRFRERRLGTQNRKTA
jgi:hypothetical protein